MKMSTFLAWIAIAFTFPTLIWAQSTQPALGTYEIYNQSSGLPMINKGGATGNGYSIVQGNDDHGTDAMWQITQVSPGSYKITNLASGLALVDAGYQQGNGMTIGQWAYDGGADALWKIVSVGNGYYQIINQSSGLSLVDAGYTQGPASTIGQWTYDGGSDAHWLLSSKAVRGGSDLNFYQNPATNADITNYPILKDYNLNDPVTGKTVRSEVQADLAAMYANGQRQIDSYIWYCVGCGVNNAFYIDPTPYTNSSGQLDYMPQQFKANLQTYLSDVKAAGFEKILLGIAPGGPVGVSSMSQNSSGTWYFNCTTETSSQITTYTADNWGLIQELHSIAVASNMPYLLDIGQETMLQGNPAACATTFEQTLWNNYVASYGTTDTVGFSMVDLTRDLAQLPLVYGNNPPAYLDFHIYCNSATDCSNKPQEIDGGVAILKTLPANYQNIPWLIGETDYNQGLNATAMLTEMAKNSINFSYLLQWSGTTGSTANIGVPVNFNNYINAGY